MKQKKSPHVILLILLSIFTVLVLAVACYHSLRRTATRLSLDFYYPYLKILKVAESRIADEALLLKSKPELAAA